MCLPRLVNATLASPPHMSNARIKEVGAGVGPRLRARESDVCRVRETRSEVHN